VMTYLIVNSGHNQDDLSKKLEQAAQSLLNKVGDLTGLGAIANFFGNQLLGIIFANCDGYVAGDHIRFTGASLARFGASHQETRNYPGLDSPVGCGANSIYKVTWSVSHSK